jgi:MFS family permease
VELRARFFSTAATIFASMALFGFYAALAPSILSSQLHQSSRAVSGGVVFELTIVSAFMVFATRFMADHRAMLLGLLLLLPSVALLVLAQAVHSLPILLAGTTFAGVAVALGYRGSLQVINRIAPADRRAEVVSAYLICGFAGNSLPIIGFGTLSSFMTSFHASILFAGTIALLAIAALIIGNLTRGSPASRGA